MQFGSLKVLEKCLNFVLLVCYEPWMQSMACLVVGSIVLSAQHHYTTFHFIVPTFFIQSFMSFLKTCPYRLDLFCCTTVIISSVPHLSSDSLITLNSYNACSSEIFLLLFDYCWSVASSKHAILFALFNLGLLYRLCYFSLKIILQLACHLSGYWG